MAITYANHNGGNFVRIARHGTLSAATYGIMEHVDPVLNYLNMSTIRSGWYPVEAVLGGYLLRPESVTGKILGFAPEKFPYNSATDNEAYGSLISGLSASMRILRGATPVIFSQGSQNQVSHYSYRGRVSNDFGSSDFQPAANTIGIPSYRFDLTGVNQIVPWGFNPPHTRGFNTVELGYFYPNYQFSPYGGSTYTVGAVYSLESAIDAIEVLCNSGTRWYWGSPHILQCYYNNFNVSRTGSVTTVSYTLTHGNSYTGSGAYHHRVIFDVVHTFDNSVNIPPAHRHLSAGEAYQIPTSVTGISGSSAYTLTASYTVYGTISNPEAWFASIDFVVGHTTTFIQPLSPLYFSSEIAQSDSGSLGINFALLAKEIPLASFGRSVFRELGHIRPSSFLSSTDAVDSLTQALDNNVIEALSELDELVTMLPDFSSAVASVKKFRGGNLIGSLGELMDFLASLRLQASFSWTPTLELLWTTVPKMIEVSRSISKMERKLQRGYGSYQYEFPQGEFGRESSSLHTRTMIIASVDPASTLSSILSLNKYGLLPTADKIWDLVPLSFVIDWFVNIGARMRALDVVPTVALLDVVCTTHTYLVTSPFTEDEISRYRLYPASSDESSLPTLRWFRRELSAHVSLPRASRYDFAMPSHEPPWLTAGALFWSIIRS